MRSLIAVAVAVAVMMAIVCGCVGQDDSARRGSRQELVPAMFVFGDSLIDNGNNNNLPSFAKANYFPYGIDFNGGPTGRFSNGYTIVDEIDGMEGVTPSTFQEKMKMKSGND